ncbi:hypothetical protein TNCV_4926361 [Trichonephila clavipes]|nr:hypothetical protein TNCV_4926361 [Trichonephila clavipes]
MWQYYLARLDPNFEEELPGVGQSPPTSLPRPLSSRENLRLNAYLVYHHASQTLHIYKHPCLFQDSKPCPMPQQSNSVTGIPDG